MTDLAATVRDHYQAAIPDRTALLSRISAALDAMAPPLGVRELASLDQFHMGGLAATIAFAGRVSPAAADRVLDAGSGLGGPARYLSTTFGCTVEGVDLSPDYVAIAQLLNERAGLGETVTFRVGDLTDLPFDDARFDLVWTQHVSMNIADRAKLYQELRRVLKRGGRLAFYDPLAADGRPDLTYPVPWAETSATSTLLTADETATVLKASGFTVVSLEDVTEEAMGWASEQRASAAASPGNAAMIVGARMAEMAANFGRNLRERRARLMVGLATASDN